MIKDKILELELRKKNLQKIYDKNKILMLYHFVCPFCDYNINFTNLYYHIKGKKCLINSKEFIDRYNIYDYNDKIKKMKNIRKYIIINNNTDMIDKEFNIEFIN